jgi:hypothetical protein
MRKIETYFTPHPEGGSTAHSLRLRSQQSSGMISTAASTTSATMSSSSSETRESSLSSSSHHPSNPPQTERATSMAELRKSNENFRIGKEQAEHKVPTPPSPPPVPFKMTLFRCCDWRQNSKLLTRDKDNSRRDAPNSAAHWKIFIEC